MHEYAYDHYKVDEDMWESDYINNFMLLETNTSERESLSHLRFENGTPWLHWTWRGESEDTHNRNIYNNNYYNKLI